MILLIKDKIVYTASVGDSRGILGTYSKIPPFFSSITRVENTALGEVKVRRSSKLKKEINFLQLTKDHKPEEPAELERIKASGGRVKRYNDYEGNKIGPYRVWEANNNKPGLSISRSIGDNIAKDIGVIATPDITQHSIDHNEDLFIVIGSDGIWDAMDNEDVINYIEYFRQKANKVVQKAKDEVNLSNSCIAHLLCEEARLRWLAIVEKDNVFIDDICCIVLEISKGSNDFKMCLNKKSEKTNKSDKKGKLKSKKSQNHPSMKDPRRGSQVDISLY